MNFPVNEGLTSPASSQQAENRPEWTVPTVSAFSIGSITETGNVEAGTDQFTGGS